jgi:hypothetical protein
MTALNTESITALVHTFYADVRADPELGPVFDHAIGEHWDSHLARMVDFWSKVMLGVKGGTRPRHPAAPAPPQRGSSMASLHSPLAANQLLAPRYSRFVSSGAIASMRWRSVAPKGRK